jgi:hypothetical protein
MNRTPGTFYNHSNLTEYVALSRAADVVGVPASVITDAISNGLLTVQEVSDCKCVAVTDLFRFHGGLLKNPKMCLVIKAMERKAVERGDK